MLFSRWNNEVTLEKIRVLLNGTIDMVEILLFWVVHFLLHCQFLHILLKSWIALYFRRLFC